MKMANMNRRDIRAMFPNQMVSIDKTGVDLLDIATGERVASCVYAANSGAIVWLYNRKKVFGKPDHKAVAHVKTYEHEADHHDAAQAERRQVGRKELGDRTIKNEWNKIQEQDFKEALEIMRVFMHLLAGNTGGGVTREQYKKLNAYGRLMNTRLQNENNVQVGEAPSKASTKPPVTQSTAALTDDQALAEERDKRTVWDADDDKLFDQQQRLHKEISNRLAEMHAARGSKISMPEWDRRKNAKEKV
jgi:hypothetical protein|uniref:Uncharacterized protein n=1 Tax=Myoviridae sp. ctshb19 TaxID=2825194 RepID=A0A8S5UGT6_9CAUD|nr:MAG TPA: hypothetical protein [Myoviridae sp. ctshb19]